MNFHSNDIRPQPSETTGIEEHRGIFFTTTNPPTDKFHLKQKKKKKTIADKKTCIKKY